MGTQKVVMAQVMILEGPTNPVLNGADDDDEGDKDFLCSNPDCREIVVGDFDTYLMDAVGVVIAKCAKCGTYSVVTRGAW